MSIFCPCGSALEYNICCEPYITGKKIASEPGILMRSRYSAYVKRNVDYIIISWHPDCCPENFRDTLIQKERKWHGLTVIEESVGSHINEGFVEFSACFTDKNTTKKIIIHERSRFLRVNKIWYYIDGIFKYPISSNNDI